MVGLVGVRVCVFYGKPLKVSGAVFESCFEASYPSLRQQEAEMWLCRLPVSTDALTSVSQHCGVKRSSQRIYVFVFFAALAEFSGKPLEAGILFLF